MRTLLLFVLTLLTTTGAIAEAQSGQSPNLPRAVVSVGAAWQATTRSFDDSFTFDQYAEQGQADVDYKVNAGPVFEGGIGVRLWKALGVGVSVSRFTDSSAAKVTATVPHPFFFDRPRAVEGDATGVTREEKSVHAQVQFFAQASRRVLVVLSGGPSFVTARQEFVSRVNWDESYPFDTATFRSADTRQQSGSAVGFNAGADVIFMIGRSFGLGGLVRYTQATVDLEPTDTRTVSVETGGFQAGAGIRVIF